MLRASLSNVQAEDFHRQGRKGRKGHRNLTAEIVLFRANFLQRRSIRLGSIPAPDSGIPLFRRSSALLAIAKLFLAQNILTVSLAYLQGAGGSTNQ